MRPDRVLRLSNSITVLLGLMAYLVLVKVVLSALGRRGTWLVLKTGFPEAWNSRFPWPGNATARVAV